MKSGGRGDGLAKLAPIDAAEANKPLMSAQFGHQCGDLSGHFQHQDSGKKWSTGYVRMTPPVVRMDVAEPNDFELFPVEMGDSAQQHEFMTVGQMFVNLILGENDSRKIQGPEVQ